MALVDLVRDAREHHRTTKDGAPVPVELLPPLDARGIADFEKQLPAPLPEAVRELLGCCRGFTGPLELVDLRNADIGFGFSWGRYGPRTVVRRFTPHAVFAVERRSGLLRSLFGGA